MVADRRQKIEKVNFSARSSSQAPEVLGSRLHVGSIKRLAECPVKLTTPDKDRNALNNDSRQG
jgi:hypothetical protein